MNFQQQQALAAAQGAAAGYMTPQQQQQLAMAQQMAAQHGGWFLLITQSFSYCFIFSSSFNLGAAGAGGMTAQQQQQLAMASQMASQYGTTNSTNHKVLCTFINCKYCRRRNDSSATTAARNGPAIGITAERLLSIDYAKLGM